MLTITEKTKTDVLATIRKLPPIEVLSGCQTISQRMHWETVRQGYRLLSDELERYFQGQGSRIPYLPSPERRYWSAMRDRYIAWYAVVQYGWRYVEEGFSRDLGSSISEYSGLSGMPIDSPAGALIRVLQEECWLSLDEMFRPYYSFTPSRYREINKRQKRIDKGKAKPHEVKRHNAELKREFAPAMSRLAFGQKCIDCCELASAEDDHLANLTERYYEASERVCKEIDFAISTKGYAIGYEWSKGDRVAMAKHGGVPMR